MSMHIGGATITVVEASRGGMNCDAYKSHLDMVLTVIDNGRLGIALGEIGYGSDAHKKALDQVQAQLKETRREIHRRDVHEYRQWGKEYAGRAIWWSICTYGTPGRNPSP